MASPLSKIFILVTLVFALIGQGLAYAGIGGDMHSNLNGCDMSHHKNEAEQNPTQSQHQSHSEHQSKMYQAEMMSGTEIHHEMATTKSDNADCCKTECYCPITGCSSQVFISSGFATAVEHLQSEFAQVPSFMHLSIALKSLYRPPIIA